jgi:hypothetical protein
MHSAFSTGPIVYIDIVSWLAAEPACLPALIMMACRSGSSLPT